MSSTTTSAVPSVTVPEERATDPRGPDSRGPATRPADLEGQRRAEPVQPGPPSLEAVRQSQPDRGGGEAADRIYRFRLVSLLEIALFLILALLVDAVWGNGTRFADATPHPFWALVILISLQYGTNEGLVAAIAAAFALRLGNLPEPAFDQDIYAYWLQVSLTPILWLITAVAIGELRVRQINERSRLIRELGTARAQNEVLQRQHEVLSRATRTLEARLAGQLRTVLTTFEAARAIEQRDPEAVLNGVREMVRMLIAAQKFSVFLRTEDGMEAVLTEGWAADEPYSRQFTRDHPLWRDIIAQQAVLCIAYPDGRALSGEGVMAGPLVSRESGKLVGMLKVEEMPFPQLSAATIESFRSVCEWIGTVYTNARDFQQARAESVINPDVELLSNSYYLRHTRFLTSLGRRLRFDVTEVGVTLENDHMLDRSQFIAVGRMLGPAVAKVLRTTDLAFDNPQGRNGFTIVLPATPIAGARIVADKLGADLNGRLAEAKLVQVQVAIRVEPLFEVAERPPPLPAPPTGGAAAAP